MSEKHTPGPWKTVPPTTSRASRIGVSAMDDQVTIYDAPLTVETAYNACLIAAAPELLEACKAMSEARRLSSGIYKPADIEAAKMAYADAAKQIEAAIAKAEGKAVTP